MKRNLIISSLLAVSVAVGFSACSTMIDGSIDGVAYMTHSVTGVDYPMKSGKIYLESTTAEDTKDMTPANAQIFGFDNVVAKNVMQCDSLPELTDVLTEHGWKITNNKEEADYQVSVSTVYCGYAKKWLRKSNREQKLSSRAYYWAYNKYINDRGFTLTPEEALSGKGKMIELAAEYYDIRKFKHYFNVFDYKYDDAPQHIKDLANANAKHAYKKLRSANTAGADGIRAGANVAGMGNSKAGLAFAAVGILMGAGGPPIYAGYKTEVKIYDPATGKTTKEYIDGMSSLDKNVDKYNMYKYDADTFASGIFYK